MIAKIITIALLLIIFYCLGSAAYFMVSKKNDPQKMAKALSWRIGLSLGLFIFLMIGFFMGWVQPNSAIIM